MYDENQTFVPESFSAIYLDDRKRLTIPKQELAERSEFCEDLANMLTDQCSTVHFRDGVDTGEILERTLRGLSQPASGVSHAESWWVTRRAAELLGWEWPSLLGASHTQAPAPKP